MFELEDIAKINIRFFVGVLKLDAKIATVVEYKKTTS